jgi:hypothetical protein
MIDMTQFKTLNGIKRARCAILTRIGTLTEQLAELDTLLHEIQRYEPMIVHGLKEGDEPESIARDLDIDVGFVKMYVTQRKGQVSRSGAAKLAHENRMKHRVKLARRYYQAHPEASLAKFARYMGFTESIARNVVKAMEEETDGIG